MPHRGQGNADRWLRSTIPCPHIILALVTVHLVPRPIHSLLANPGTSPKTLPETPKLVEIIYGGLIALPYIYHPGRHVRDRMH